MSARFPPSARGLAIALIAATSLAHALPVELKDSNGTKYNINTQVIPLSSFSNASGALTNATFVKPVTVTSYYIAFTPWFFFLTTYTVQRQINVPLTPAFEGFNGLLIAGLNGERLTVPLVFNPGQPLAAEDCSQNGKNRQLAFATQTFAEQNLSVTRKVYVPDNSEWVRWLNIVTNTGSSPNQVGISLLGLIASGDDTKVVNQRSPIVRIESPVDVLITFVSSSEARTPRSPIATWVGVGPVFVT